MTCKFQSIKSHFHAPLKHTTTWLSRKHLLTLSRSETQWITDNLKSFLKYNPEQWNGTIPNLHVPCTIQCSNMHLYIPITQSWNVFHKLICKIISYKLFKKITNRTNVLVLNISSNNQYLQLLFKIVVHVYHTWGISTNREPNKWSCYPRQLSCSITVVW